MPSSLHLSLSMNHTMSKHNGWCLCNKGFLYRLDTDHCIVTAIVFSMKYRSLAYLATNLAKTKKAYEIPAVPTKTATVKIHRKSLSSTIATYFQSSKIWKSVHSETSIYNWKFIWKNSIQFQKMKCSIFLDQTVLILHNSKILFSAQNHPHQTIRHQTKLRAFNNVWIW